MRGSGLAPFFFSLLHTFLRRFANFLVNCLHHRIGILPAGEGYLQFIPQPLACGREIKIVSFNGVAVGKGDAPASWMTGVGPVARFEQHRVERADLYHLSGNSVDLYPVSQTNAVFAHQHKPADETDDEVFQCHGKAGAGKSEKCAELTWQAKHHESDQAQPYNLGRNASDRAQ